MSNAHHAGGTRPSGHDPQHGSAHDGQPQQPRRRRSLEDSGGLSVSDLVERHTGSRTNIPLPPLRPAGEPAATRSGRHHPVDLPQRGDLPQPFATDTGGGRRRVDRHDAQPVQGTRRADSGRPAAARPPGNHAAPGPTGAAFDGPSRTPQPPQAPRAPRPTTPRSGAPVPAGRVTIGTDQRSVRLPGPAQTGRPAATDSGRFAAVARPGRPTGATDSGHFPLAGQPGRPAAVPARPAGVDQRTHYSAPAQPGRPIETNRQPAGPEQQRGQHSAPRGAQPAAPTGHLPLPPAVDELDALTMTTQMEPIGEATQKRRKVDETLARFSAVHDELAAEERERKSRRMRLPWSGRDELEMLDALSSNPAMRIPPPLSADEPQDRPATRLQRKKQHKRTRTTTMARAGAGVTALLVFVATGAAWGFKSWVESGLQQISALDENSSSIQQAEQQRGDENFLLVGSDSRAGAEPSDHVGTDSMVPGARSDTTMIAHIPADRSRVVIVSFPRDLEVDRPACEQWDPKTNDYIGQTVAAKSTVKLNSAFEVGGPKCVTKLVQQISGLKINHYVGIDFDGFKGMVDAVQGVQVCVEKPIKDGVLGTIVPEPGKEITLTGDQALSFVRARHVKGDLTSDYGRIIRQQRFLSSLLRKAMSNQVLLDPGKLTSFLDAFSKATVGDNVGVDQLFTLGESLQQLDAGRVTFVTVPTVGEANERGNEVLRESDTKALFGAIIGNTPLPGEKPAEQTTDDGSPANQATPPPAGADTSIADPKTVKIQVLNGGNPTTGVARRAADKLAGVGFEVVRVDNAPETVATTTVKFGAGKDQAARTLAAAIPGAQIQQDPALAGVVMLVIGPDFSGNVVAPQAGGAAPPATPAPEKLPENLTTVNGADVSCV